MKLELYTLINKPIFCGFFFFFCKEVQYSLLLKIGPTGCPQTAVRNYHYTLRNIAEVLRSHEFVCCLKR